jgi:EAL domain-containing protein (putative c-di-GMP-specific phosphodiesterase class I)
MAYDGQKLVVGPHDLRAALARNELFLVYQPQFSIADAHTIALTGVEALLRWNHPRTGIEHPNRFMCNLPQDLMGDVGLYVLKRAVAQIRDWRARLGWSPSVAINVSGSELAQPGWAERFLITLDFNLVATSDVIVEITETEIIPDLDEAARHLRVLQHKGVRVHIDDFGSGFCSFDYLLRLPNDALKIKASYVRGIGTSPEALEVCRAIINLGRALDKRVIAEGVEQHQQLDFLRRAGCTEAQGHLLSRALTSEELVERFLAAMPCPVRVDGSRNQTT